MCCYTVSYSRYARKSSCRTTNLRFTQWDMRKSNLLSVQRVDNGRQLTKSCRLILISIRKQYRIHVRSVLEYLLVMVSENVCWIFFFAYDFHLGAVSRHVRIHHRNHKPYICPHCQRAFSKAETMKNHIMTHTGKVFNWNIETVFIEKRQFSF